MDRINPAFDLQWNRGGITGLKLPGDVYDTEYIWQGETLGDVVVRYRAPGGEWREASAFSSGDIRTCTGHPAGNPRSFTFSYHGDSLGVHGIRDLDLDIEFLLEPDGLYWRIHFQNRTEQVLELGDVALPLPFNKDSRPDNLYNYTRIVARHSFISGHGSFLFWMRPNGTGPFLVMTPLDGTRLEYYEQHNRDLRAIRVPYWVYIHSAVNGAGETRGSWRQPHTLVRLEPGERLSYGFKFQWAADYEAVREVLYTEGLFEVQVVPGMTIPCDLTALLSLRTRHKNFALVPEHVEQTKIEYLGERAEDTHLYRLKFERLGENRLTVQYGQDRYMVLEFFLTESLETLIKKRAAFLVDRQQHRDAAKWWDGLFSVWDMRHAVLRGPDNTDGFDRWWGYVLACDDTALPKAPFIAAKNLHYPVASEIAAIEYYVEHFVWGKLQRTDQEGPYPFGIYGVPNWFENRNNEHGMDSGGRGAEHIWRSYDYQHLFMLYYHLYQIAKQYPGMTHYLDATGYLKRAFGTAKAYFTLQHLLPKWGFSFYRRSYWAYTLGIFNELLLLDLMRDLSAEGYSQEAEWLRGEWEIKVKYFVYDEPYPFDSEYPTDTTAFESSHAIAKYGLENTLKRDENLWHDEIQDKWYSHPEIKRQDFQEFMEKQIRANIALRGWLEPAYYLLGSDLRGGEGVRYNLSYMSQLGGWAIVDYALYHARDPFPYLRLGYASFLSSWALMNTGTPESDYGYWYGGQENDGASGWAFTPEKYGPMWIRQNNPRGAWFYDGEIDLGYSGALRTAATIVAEDPLFGWFAYGGVLTHDDETLEVVPRDGLRKRFHLVTQDTHLHLILDWDGFAAEQPIRIKQDLTELAFLLENRTGDAHAVTLNVDGLPSGTYVVQSRELDLAAQFTGPHARITLRVGAGGPFPICLRKGELHNPEISILKDQ